MIPIQRIHHISATVADANENLHFYRDVLNLRLVKKTVNFEDNGTYHLYFANKDADAGSVITFFPLSKDIMGRVGSGQVRRIAFSVPKGSISEWAKHFEKLGINYTQNKLFKATALFFNDPHGLSLGLVEADMTTSGNDIIGFFGVELLSHNPDETLKLLLNDMGLQLLHEDKDYYHLEMAGKEKHRILIQREVVKRGRLGIGKVHHIAWSIPDKETLNTFRDHFERDFKITKIKDRKYFHSAYFRDPGHIIYELATEGPGFTVDESLDELGTNLMLPEQYEKQRDEIEAALPKLT